GRTECSTTGAEAVPAEDANPIAAIQRGEVGPLYCLHGPETYLLDLFVAAIRTAVLGPGADRGGSFNYDTFALKEASPAPLLHAARTLPMFAKRRLVIARGIDHLKSDDLEPLIAYVADPNPSTCLALVGEKVDARLRVFQAIRKTGSLHEFARLKDRELGSWL